MSPSEAAYTLAYSHRPQASRKYRADRLFEEMLTHERVCIPVDGPRASSDGRASATAPSDEPSTATDAPGIQPAEPDGAAQPESLPAPEAETKEDAVGAQDESTSVPAAESIPAPAEEPMSVPPEELMPAPRDEPAPSPPADGARP
jgi:hypothetical protein